MTTINKQECFTEQDTQGMTHEQFQTAISGLIQKGLAEEVEVDGVKMYRLTSVGKEIGRHLSSTPKDQN